VLFAFFLVWYSQEKIPRRASVEPPESTVAVIKEVPTINIEKIYKHDLFDTYREVQARPESTLPELPPPPSKATPRMPVARKASFLEPLGITLKGIMIVSGDDAKSRVIIGDNKTNQEAVYKVGDKIEDAQLIRIFKNKIMFVRANGQQEILYLREKDAKADPTYSFLKGWEDVIEKVSDTEFNVDPNMFVDRVQNLAQVIDSLDLSTAYRHGSSVGCRVGSIPENSLGSALGLKFGDIIITVNDIPAINSTKRYEIYKLIINSKIDDIIKVRLERSGQELAVSYNLQELKKPEVVLESGSIVTESAIKPEQIKEKEVESMHERHNFAPTIEQIRAREKENMLRRGRKPKQSIAE